jgi:hypothetical protein
MAVVKRPVGRPGKRDVSLMHINVPNDMKAWLETSARREDRTITAKVIRCLAAEMQRERETEKA